METPSSEMACNSSRDETVADPGTLELETHYNGFGVVGRRTRTGRGSERVTGDW
jgi:hypothetical protein